MPENSGIFILYLTFSRYMRFTYLQLLAVVFVLFVFQTKAQVNYQELNQYITKAKIDFGAAGLAVGVVKDGDVIFQNGYGYEDAEEGGNKITTYSNFAIASVSKSFTAMAISNLANDGKLNLNDKVIKHLPYFKLNDPVITNLLTVEDLLCHRSGLSTFDGDLLWYGSNYTPREILLRIANRPLEQEFRASYGYQNIMFIAAAQIIEVVSGKTWAEYIHNTFLKPLGMIETYTSPQDFKPNTRVAYPHINSKKIPSLNYDNAWGAVGLNTTTTDMTIWMRFLLNGGYFQDNRYMEEVAVAETFLPRNYLKLGGLDKLLNVNFKAYGLGWFMMDYQGKKVIHHGGGLPGYITQIAMVPEEKLGVIIMSNDGTMLPYAVLYKILDEFLIGKGKKEDWVAKFLEFEKKKIEAAENYQTKLNEKFVKKAANTLSISSFAGTYEDEMYGKADIYLEKKKLVLKLLPSNLVFTSELIPWYKNGFKIKFKDPFLPEGLVNFDIEGDKIKGFTIDLPNPDFHFHKLYFKKS